MSDQFSNEPSPPTPPQGRPKPRRWRTIIKRLVIVSLLTVTVSVAVTVYLARSEPAYWKEHQAFLNETSPKQVQALADQVNAQLQALATLGLDQAGMPRTDPTAAAAQTINALADLRAAASGANRDDDLARAKLKPEDVHINVDQTLTLNNQQIAAVVQTRLDRWMRNRGYVKPNEITDPMIAVDKGKLVMAFELQAGGFTQVISGKFSLKIQDNGMAEMKLKRFLVGKLPVPANAIGEYLRNKSGGDPHIEKAGEWLEKLQHFTFKPVIEIENRRRIRLMDYKLLDHGLELTVRVQDHKTYKAMNQALAGVPTD